MYAEPAGDERIITTVLHVEGGRGEPMPPTYIDGSASLREIADQLGVTLRFEYRREPWTQAELDRGDFESRVATLREEFPDGNYPDPIHPADEPCTECEALRWLEDRA